MQRRQRFPQAVGTSLLIGNCQGQAAALNARCRVSVEKAFPAVYEVKRGTREQCWNMHWTSCQQTPQLPAVSTARKQIKLTRLSLTGLTMVQINK